jgi:hypothetical protein
MLFVTVNRKLPIPMGGVAGPVTNTLDTEGAVPVASCNNAQLFNADGLTTTVPPLTFALTVGAFNDITIKPSAHIPEKTVRGFIAPPRV